MKSTLSFVSRPIEDQKSHAVLNPSDGQARLMWITINGGG